MDLPDVDNSSLVSLTENHLAAKCHVSYVAGQIVAYEEILKDLTQMASDLFMAEKEIEAKRIREYAVRVRTSLNLRKSELEDARSQEYRYADLSDSKEETTDG